jgi:glycosyltransferase involved in cell wall biosynthesis
VTKVSIIVPAYRAGRTIDAVLGAAVPQAAAAGAELIVVDSTGDGAAEALQRRWPQVRVIGLAQRTYPGRARNIGARHAVGDVLVFLDADAVPSPSWLRTMLGASEETDVAVAGAIANGTPRSPTGTAGWLLEFSNWLPGSVDRPDHAASASLAVRRAAFDEAGGFVEEVWPGEDTILTFPWGSAAGIAFAGDAVVHHLNRTGIADFLRHQHALGEAFGDVCGTVPFDHGWLARRPWSALGGGLRVLALARRLRRRPKEALQAVAVAPWLVAGLIAWTLGLWRRGGRR